MRTSIRNGFKEGVSSDVPASAIGAKSIGVGEARTTRTGLARRSTIGGLLGRSLPETIVQP